MRLDKQDALAQRAGLVGGGVLLLVVLQLVASAFYTLASRLYGGAPPAALLGGLRVAFTLLLLAVPLRFLCFRGFPVGLRIPTGKPVVPAGLLLPLFLAVVLAVNLLVAWLTLRTGVGEGSASAFVVPERAGPLALYFVSVCLLPAIGEELLFRGAVQGLLRPFGRRAALLATAVLFTCMHAAGWDSIAVFVLGALLCWVREATGSLRACIVLHFANNLVAFFGLVIQAHVPDTARVLTGVLAGLTVAGSAVAGVYMGKKGYWACFIMQEDVPLAGGLARLSHVPRFTAALFLACIYCVGRGFAS